MTYKTTHWTEKKTKSGSIAKIRYPSNFRTAVRQAIPRYLSRLDGATILGMSVAFPCVHRTHVKKTARLHTAAFGRPRNNSAVHPSGLPFSWSQFTDPLRHLLRGENLLHRDIYRIFTHGQPTVNPEMFLTVYSSGVKTYNSVNRYSSLVFGSVVPQRRLRHLRLPCSRQCGVYSLIHQSPVSFATISPDRLVKCPTLLGSRSTFPVMQQSREGFIVSLSFSELVFCGQFAPFGADQFQSKQAAASLHVRPAFQPNGARGTR